jgi:tight adherence protein C
MLGQTTLGHIAHEPFLLYGIVLLAAACLVFGIAALRETRLVAPTARKGSSSMDWVVTNISTKFVPTEQSEHNDLKARLLQAGFESAKAVEIYYGVRVAGAILGPAAAVFILPLYVALPTNVLLLICTVLALLFFLAPAVMVRLRRASRQQKFRDGLPDVLDLLLVCSEAGLGIDTAIIKVAEQMETAHPLLARQLNLVSSELRAGLDRAAAMRGLADRTGIDETVSMVNLLTQSDALGTSMAQTLRAFSEDMRAHRMLAAEELAHKVSAKLTVILVLCFLPGIFAAIMAPTIFIAIKSMQTLSVSTTW